jgi:putative transposase
MDLFEPDQVYHIYNRANGDENLFRESQNYHFFLQKYFAYINPVAETYAYCLLPNHFHAMIRIKEEKVIEEGLKEQNLQGFENLGGLSLSKLVSQRFSNFFNSYTKALNKRYQRKGSLFTPNIKRKQVNQQAYFTRLIIYIHNNPVKHGFVKDAWDWPYSSIQEFKAKGSAQANENGHLEPSLKQNIINWFGDFRTFETLHLELVEQSSVFE